MYICICHGVTESQIREAVQGGADSLDTLRAELGIGTRCGTCVCAAQSLLEEVSEELGDHRPHTRPTLSLVVSRR
jgi:bacterioferritin-associated ferredoxin